jgi:hypothetical protein
MGCPHHVRFTPVSDRTADITSGPVRATSGHSESPEGAAVGELVVGRLRVKARAPRDLFFPQHVVAQVPIVRRDDREMIFTTSGAQIHRPADVRGNF